jgi:hypothetical protein
MFPTLEVRWFFRGTVPAEVRAWFQRGEGEPEAAPSRVDHYLRLGGNGGLGIKVREGRLELKQRQGQQGALVLHQRVMGRVEHWRKWSFALVEGSSELDRMLIPPRAWIGVTKARLLRRYLVTSEDRIVPTSTAEYPERACDWELTQVHVRGSAWWTVGFEAFGQETVLQETLRLVAGQVLAAREPPRLEIQDSFGYPEWLGMLG